MLNKKAVIVGDPFCGKTCLIYSFKNGTYPGNMNPTVYEEHKVVIKVDEKKIQLVLTDVISDSAAKPMRLRSYKGTDVFIVCFAVSSYSSLKRVKDQWMPEIQRFSSTVPVILVANKMDSRTDPSIVQELDKQQAFFVSSEEGRDMAEKIGARYYLECSAKTQEGVREVFVKAAYATFESGKEANEARKNNHKQAYIRAIKEKFSLNVCPVHFNHIGISRSGKTSFQRRMMGEITNLLAALKEGEEFQPSTGVAEAGGQVFIRSLSTRLGTIQSRVWTTVKDVKEEASMLNQFIYQTVTDTTPRATGDALPPFNPSAATTNRPARLSALNKPIWKKFLSLFDRKPGNKVPKEKDMEETFAVIREVMEDEKWDEVRYLLDDIILLINTDTGGQAEFLDLQASLVLGPSLNFLYSRLVDDLDKQFKTYYTSEKGLSTERLSSTNTVEEVLFQALASIACLGGFPLQSDDEKQPRHTQSKAIFMGTHRDLITDEELKRKDEILQQKVKNTEFYSRNIVEFASENQMMVAVDNMTGDLKEIEQIRVLLEQIIVRNFDKIAIPAAWLMFSLCIRNTGARTMSIHECEKIAAKLQIAPSELQDALWFLHHHIGVLLYYPEIKSLKDTVICDLQVVFDSASNLIKNTFTFELVGHQRSLTFREKGQFTLSDLNKAASGYTDNLLSLQKLVDLLEDRNVLTIMPPSGSSSTREEPTYFMPCVLKSASLEELLTTATAQSSSDPAPLMLRYDCGYFPIGVFPAMITNLVSQQREDWLLIDKGLRKNRVQFRVGDNFDIVTLVLHPQFLEIQMTRRSSLEIPVAPICDQIRRIVQHTLDKVTSHLNYHFKMGYKFGFLCPIHSEKLKDHICLLARESAINMECPEDNTRPVPLQPQHKVWFSSAQSNINAITSESRSLSPCPSAQAQYLVSSGESRNQSPCPSAQAEYLVSTNESTKRSPCPSAQAVGLVSTGGSTNQLPCPSAQAEDLISTGTPSLRSLNLLKWQDEQGQKQTFRLVDKVSAKWEEFGILLGLEHNQLSALRREKLGEAEECWNSVMEHWRQGGSPDLYPPTWEGLYSLLRDMEYEQIAIQLEAAVKKATVLS